MEQMPEQKSEKKKEQTTKVNQAVIFTFLKSALAVSILIILINWVTITFRLDKRLRNINLEVWIGLILTLGTTYLQFNTEREREKLQGAEEKSKENRKIIEAISKQSDEANAVLKSRIDSLLIQMAQIKQDQNAINQKLDALEYGDRALEKTMADYRLQYHKERIELIKSFYVEFCQVNGSLAYLKGHKDGNYNASTENRLESILTLLGEPSANPDALLDENEATKKTDE
jgi:hypothetical protein